MKDKIIRGKFKWAKISGQRGRYCVAYGWKGQFEATRKEYFATRSHAFTCAEGYINDNG